MAYKFLNSLTVINSTFSSYNSGGTANDSLKVSSSNLGASFGVQNTNASGYAGIEYIDNSGNVKVFTGFNNGNGQEFRFNNVASGGYIDFLIGGTTGLKLFNNRNVTIGSATDSGYKLDVNGTGRFSGNLLINGTNIPLSITGSGSSNFSMNSGNDVYFAFNSQSAVGRFYANPQGSVQYTYDQPSSVGFVGTLAGGSVWYGNMNTSGGAVKYNASINGATHSHIWYHNFSEQMRLAYTGNLLIGTATDAGYKLDVNGTTRINSTLSLTNSTYAGTFSFYLSAANVFQASSSNVGVWLQVGGGNRVYIIGQEFNSTARGNIFGNTVGGEAISATTIIAQSSGTTATTGLSLRYTINNTGTYVGISRGIYYNPTITSLTGTTHRAIETVTGDVIFGSTSGNVGIGTASPSYKLDVNGTARATTVITDTITTSGSTTLASYAGTTYTYGPIVADPASFTFTFQSQPILYGSISSGYVPKANMIGMGNSLIYQSGSNNILINSTTDTGYKLQVAGDVNINTASTTNNLVVNADTSMFYNLTSGGGQVKSNVYTTSKTTRYYVPPLSTEYLIEWDPTLCQGIFVDYVILIQGPNFIRSGTLVIANDNGGNVTITDNINSSVNGSSTAFVTFSTAGLASIKLGCNNLLAANDVYVNIVTRYIPNIY